MIPRRSMLAVLAFALAVGQAPLAASAAPSPSRVSPVIQKAIDNPARAQKQRDRDAARKPGETLALVGLKPGDRVIELAAFGQYYTDIMAEVVGPKGRIYMYDLPYLEKPFGAATRAFVQSHPNTEFVSGKYDELDYPKNVDLVAIVLYYHDLQPNKVDTAKLNAKLYQALKPGGRLLIIDHKAEDGSGWRDAATIHRMGVDTIVKEVTAAGFRLRTNSDLLANPKDDRKKMVFEPGERGHTDQAVFVFEKPR
jgi:predicted methyltransferase